MAQYTFDTLKDFELAGISLPSGYTKQLSLISDGNQYILLPSTNGNPSGVRISFKILASSGEKAIYGQINNNAPYFGKNGNNFGFAYKSGTAYSTQVAVDFNKHIADINYNADKEITLDGNLLFTATAYYANNKPLAIFNAYHNNGVSTGQPCEIFYAEPTINDTNGNVLSKMTLIPASNNGDLGLYDIENDIFYTNNGTGAFTSGGTAPTYTFQNGDVIKISSKNKTYKYVDGNLVFWYNTIPPLVFRGMTFEQTDFWQKPEFVFRGFSFEITDKTGGASMFHGMS